MIVSWLLFAVSLVFTILIAEEKEHYSEPNYHATMWGLCVLDAILFATSIFLTLNVLF